MKLRSVKNAINPGLKIIAGECQKEGYGEYKFEYVFAPPRRYRFDLCFPSLKVAFERDGGTWGKSRHTSGKGFRDDCRKMNLAAADGWLVVRATADMMQDGSALTDLLTVLEFQKYAPLQRPSGRGRITNALGVHRP